MLLQSSCSFVLILFPYWFTLIVHLSLQLFVVLSPVMELKVWVEGVVRVVCGLSLDTSCQDVVISLAQAIGRTGRYVLVLKLRGNERHLLAADRPLQRLARLGQQAAQVQFFLRRTGPSPAEGQSTPSRERRLPLPGPPQPEPVKGRQPQKALTFSLGPSTHPWRTKPNRAWSPSPRASPEPRASPVPFLDSPSSVPPSSSKEEVFRQILQQQRRLQDLDIQLQVLERQTALWEQQRTSAGSSRTPDLADELEELEQRARQNEEELLQKEDWEEHLEVEMEREGDIHRRLQQKHSSLREHTFKIRALHTRSAHLEQDLLLTAPRRSSGEGPPPPNEALRPLKEELQHRLLVGEEMDATQADTRRKLQAAEGTVKVQLFYHVTAQTISELSPQ
ncbi:ras association domain-containing protein 7-like isoform X2 [Embiotoca jacksoni]|uniref:ras association domain-containing protein 7-like isoform X2 n=1 Tax=Embiotoca jacksoni TaxID=100190 RepID=UPI0037045877